MKPKTRNLKKGDRQPTLKKAGLTEVEVWWHKCGLSGRKEYRANGWECSQCGAVGPNGNVAMMAHAGFLLLPAARA